MRGDILFYKFECKIKTDVTFKTFINTELKSFEFDNFSVDKFKSSINLIYNGINIGVSKWLSPKRSGSGAMAKVYDTLHLNKRLAIIPIRKDEGFCSGHSIISPTTSSWMSLFNVYIVLAYFDKAIKNENYKNKLKNQEYNNDFVREEIKKIMSFQGDAHQWNETLFRTRMWEIHRKSIDAYRRIAETTGVKVTEMGILSDKYDYDRDLKMRYELAKKAALRETQTVHENERLNSKFKGFLNISDCLGGQYYLTCDEIFEIGENKYLIQESKNSTSEVLPTVAEIKEVLLKMYLFSNIDEIRLKRKKVDANFRIKLTSESMIGKLYLKDSTSKYEIEEFIKSNKLSKSRRNLIYGLHKEVLHNNFTIIIQNSSTQEDLDI